MVANIESFNIAISFIGEIKIPSDEFYPVFEGQSPVYPKVVFQVTEERFDGICILGDIWTANEFEHIRDCTFQVDICLSDFVVGIGYLTGLYIDCFLSDELRVLFMPFVKFPESEYPVIVCPDTIYLPNKPSEHDACRCSRVLRQPGQAFPLYVYEASLPESMWVRIFDCSDYILATVSRET